MTQSHPLPSCYSRIEVEGQLPLPHACTLDNPYLVENCGTCTSQCEVPFDPGFDDTNAVTPLNRHLPSALAAVHGLRFTTTGTAVDVPSLPDRVPLVRNDRRTLLPDRPIYAISATSLFLRTTAKNGVTYRVCHDVRKRLALAPDSAVMLMGNAKDDLIQWIWENEDVASDAIRENGFEYVTTPNSAYGNKCPLEWAYNAKRSMLSAEKLHGLTPNVIVTVVLPSQTILRRYVEWLSRNPLVNCIALNLQMVKRRTEWLAAVSDAARLRDAVGRPLHFVVAGPGTERRVQLVHDLLGATTIVSSYGYNR